MKNDWSQDISEGWWIDWMEGEVEPKRRPGLKLLLEHSPTDEQIYQNFVKLREVVKMSDAHLTLPGEEFFESLHARIMQSVEALPPRVDPAQGEDAEVADSAWWSRG